MYSFRRFDRSTILFVSLVAVSFLLATFDVRSQGEGVGSVMREGAQSLFTPVQEAASFVTRPVVGFVDGVSNLAGLRDENTRLAQRVAELERLVAETEEAQRKVVELETVLGLEVISDLPAVTARIVASGPTDFEEVRFIDKGAADGIVRGQAVIDENGLIGRVDFVSEKAARVLLITDPRSGVGVRDLATNDAGWVEGRGTATMRLEMFSAKEQVSEGDLLVTDGSRFPPGIPVGIVLSAAASEVGFSLTSTVAPVVEITRLDYVKVIVGWDPLDARFGEEEEVNEEVPPPDSGGAE
jgi:rod shape-determining protein MreC